MDVRKSLAALLISFMVLSGIPAEAMPDLKLPKLAALPINAEQLSNTRKRPIPKADLQPFRLSESPSDAEFFAAKILPDPLIPMSGAKLSADDAALRTALIAYAARKDREDVSDLSNFISKNPKSRWRCSLELNMGTIRERSGYISDALKLLQSSWDIGKNEHEKQQRAAAEKAVTELMVLNSRLGRVSELQKLVDETKDRKFDGSSDLRVSRAREGLLVMKGCPSIAFKCGPWAVNTLNNLRLGRRTGVVPLLRTFASSSQGTNLAQVQQLADQVGLKYQMAKRSKGAPILVPAVFHWKLQHFAAITEEKNGRYHMQDTTFDSGGSFWVPKEVIETEGDGYFLVRQGELPEGWTSVSDSEGKTVWGKGYGANRDECKTCDYDKQDMAGGLGGDSGCGCGGGNGMPVASAFSMQATLNIKDTPLAYAPAVGPSIDVSLNYNDKEGQQPYSFNFTNVGVNWSINWLSYTDGHTVYSTRGGGYQDYNTIFPFVMSQTTLVQNVDGSYTRNLPDGSVENYTLNPSSGYYWYMTSVVDPQGNAVTINYDANTRITSIVDASGNASTTFAYVTNTVGNPGFYNLASVTDGFGRSCSFAYDSTYTYLTSITDAVGNSSSFAYQGSSTITSMQTPYGMTTFTSYVPPNNIGFAPPRGLRFHFPDNTVSAIEGWIYEVRNTYYWDREALASYPADPTNGVYTHCKTTHWLFDYTTDDIAAVRDWVQLPLETRTAFKYAGQPDVFQPGTVNKPGTVTRALVENPVQHVEVNGAPSDNPTSNIITFFDPGLPNGQESVTYNSTTSDTLATIASGFVSLINADTHLQSIGISAVNQTANPGYFSIINFSPNVTLYRWTTNGGYWVFLSFSNDPNVLTYATIGGTVTSGNTLTLTVHDAQLSGGTKSVSYTTVSGDTLTSIATALKNKLNGDANLQAMGIVARSSGAVVKITSGSYNPTTYTESTSGGATETIAYSAQAQIDQYSYNPLGHISQHIDPIGRTFSYTYGTNNIDLSEIRETKGTDNYLIGHWDYNSASNPHCPTDYIDGSAQKTQYGYNSLSELQTIEDPNSNTTTLSYDTHGYLTQIQGPLSGNKDITTFSFFGYGPVHTITDSEGYVLTYAYDNLNRLTSTTYLDGTSEKIIYDKRDAILKSDRLGRWTQNAYDQVDRLAFTIDPLGRKTQYLWCLCGAPAGIIDPSGKTTSWMHDGEGRVTSKVYADESATNYAYETILGRLLTRTDALKQTTTYSYNNDNTLAQKTYTNAVNATQPVTYSYDQSFPRIHTIANGDWGTYTYSYNNYVTNPLGTKITGGGRLSTITNNVIANSTVSYSYDALGRVSNRSINGSANSTTWTYDAMSRITQEQNPLGTFGYAYVDDTAGSSKGTLRLASINYPNSQVTNFSWYGNTGDQRLEQISNLNPSGATLSQFNYGYDSAGEIKQWGQIQNNTSLLYALGYDASGQLVSAQAGSGSVGPSYLNQYFYGYDPSANRTAVQQSVAQRIRIGGTVTSGNVLTIAVHDTGLTGGTEAVNYTVVSGDTLSTIATKLAAAITADTKLQALGVNAAASSSTVTVKSVSPNVTSYTGSLSGGSTETITIGATNNFVENVTVGGTKTTGDVLTIKVRDPALTGGSESVPYTVLSADTLTTIATGIKNAINADSHLSTLGVTATSAGTVVTIKSTSTNATTYIGSTNSTATETLFLSINVNGPQTLGISGTKTTGDIIKVYFYDPGLSGGKETVSYTVASSDTLTTIATGIKTAVNADANLQSIGLSATSSGAIVTFASNSPNITTYRESINSTATEKLYLSLPMNGTQTLAVGGTKKTSDVLTITVYDAGLSTGSQAVSYTVASADTLTSIATGLKNAVNANSNLSTIGVTATSSGAIVNILSASQNATTYLTSLSSGSTETMTLAPGIGVSLANYNNVNELIATGPGGATTFQGSANKALKSASVASNVVSISQTQPNLSTYSTSVSSGATETLTAGTNIDGNIAITVGGTVTVGNTLSIAVSNASLASSPETVSYTTITGDTTTSIATALKSAINADTKLTAIGLTATSSSSTVNIAITGTTYTESSTGSGATVTLGLNNNGNTTATIGGVPTSGNTVTVTAHNPALSGGQEAATYTLVTGDTVVTTAAGLASKINADTKLQALGISATNTTPATLTFSQSFTTQSPLSSGTNTANVSGTDGLNNTKTKPYQLLANTGTNTTLSFDANGNMTSDGTNSYSWDPENRLLKITYPGTNNYSTFTFDGLGRNVKIVETVSGSVTSTKMFVWAGYEREECRNASSAVSAQYFHLGEIIGSTNYFQTMDLLGAVRDMSNTGGAVQAEYSFDPYGRLTKLSESIPSDFTYAGYYLHAPSGLNLAVYRAYSSTLGRWISRDPLEEDAGTNLYQYCVNRPTSFADPLGLKEYSLGDFSNAIGTTPSKLINGCVDVVNVYLGLPPGSGDPGASGGAKCWIGKGSYQAAEDFAQKCSCGGVVWSKQGTLQVPYSPNYSGEIPSSAIGGPTPGQGGGFNYVTETPSGWYAYMNWAHLSSWEEGWLLPDPALQATRKKALLIQIPLSLGSIRIGFGAQDVRSIDALVQWSNFRWVRI